MSVWHMAGQGDKQTNRHTNTKTPKETGGAKSFHLKVESSVFVGVKSIKYIIHKEFRLKCINVRFVYTLRYYLVNWNYFCVYFHHFCLRERYKIVELLPDLV